jgi:hypothetical protein
MACMISVAKHIVPVTAAVVHLVCCFACSLMLHACTPMCPLTPPCFVCRHNVHALILAATTANKMTMQRLSNDITSKADLPGKKVRYLQEQVPDRNMHSTAACRKQHSGLQDSGRCTTAALTSIMCLLLPLPALSGATLFLHEQRHYVFEDVTEIHSITTGAVCCCTQVQSWEPYVPLLRCAKPSCYALATAAG